jgi:hypothetical protein
LGLEHVSRVYICEQNIKIIIHKTKLKPLVMQGSETWSKTGKEKIMFNTLEKKNF